MPPSTVQSSKKSSSDTAPSSEAQHSTTLRNSFSGCSTRCTKTSTRRPSENTSRLRTTMADRTRSLRRRRSPTTWDAIIRLCKRCSGRNSDHPWRVPDVTSRATLSIHSTAFQCNYLNCRYKPSTSEFCTIQSPRSKWRWLWACRWARQCSRCVRKFTTRPTSTRNGWCWPKWRILGSAGSSVIPTRRRTSTRTRLCCVSSCRRKSKTHKLRFA